MRATASAWGSAQSPQRRAISTAAAASTASARAMAKALALSAASNSAGALRGVETDSLGRAESFVAQLGVADVARANGEQQLDGDLVGNQLVVRKNNRGIDHLHLLSQPRRRCT